MDLATLTAAPTTVTVGGRDFKIGPLRFQEWGVIQRWLNAHVERPDDAPKGWKPPQVLAGWEWIEALFSDEQGIVTFLYVLFSKHQGLSEADFDHIVANVGPAHLAYLQKVAMDFPEEVEGAGGPKAPPAP